MVHKLPLSLVVCLLAVIGAHAFGDLFSESLLREGQVQTVLEHKPVTETECRQATTGPIETTACDFESVESVNEELYDHLHNLVQTPFFKFFRVDLYRECPFWQENVFCANQGCGITTVDENEIPEKWRAASLSKLNAGTEDETVVMPGCYYRNADFCVLDDETEGDYIDLTSNPERYTGYSGPSAARVWRSIYEENCFGQAELTLLSGKAPAAVTLPETLQDPLRDENGNVKEQCLEKRVYYKIISGLHASISTHICHEYLDPATGDFKPSLACFINRVAAFPERLQYIYFDTVLLLRAVARIAPYLSSYDYCSTNDAADDAHTLEKLSRVTDIARRVGRFDETVLFRGENANVLREEFKTHFRNVSRIMDCVGCDKCRLWGKVQFTGIATAMKILFELDETAFDPVANPHLLQRSEVVALINTLHRLSETLHAVDSFRRMWANTDEAESGRLIREAGKAAEAPTSESTAAGSADGILALLREQMETARRALLKCISILSGKDKHLGPTADEF